GFIFDDKEPEAILLTYDIELTYEKLEKLTYLVRKGIPYYATHPDIVCPTDRGSLPDIGTFIEVIRLTTGIVPNRIFGKPNKDFINPILKKHGLSYSDTVIIGDRLYTDIKLAENSDITSILVLSGETTRKAHEKASVKADIVVNSVAELIEFI
ncbi:MAG: HAD hydrolase-like protein, partial [Promethearchaeota archaeon]